MNHSNVHKILTKRCGDMWEIKFDSDDLNIHKTVSISIPRLLPEETIRAILKKAEANKTYEHGQTKNSYLLGRMVFCKYCGYTMFGQTNQNGHRYYRHAHTKRDRVCNHPKTWVGAEELEDIVMRHLFDCFGSPLALQRAIEKATPNLNKLKEYQKRIKEIDGLLVKSKTGRERILNLIAKGVISDNDAEEQLLEIKQNDSKWQLERQQLSDNLANSPSPEKIADVAKNVANQLRSCQLQKNIQIRVNSRKTFDELTYEEKKALVKIVFSGKTLEGQRMGVFIEWNEKGWKFDIRGHLIEEEGLFVLSDSQKQAYFDEYGGGNTGQAKELITKYATYLQGTALPLFRFHADSFQLPM